MPTVTPTLDYAHWQAVRRQTERLAAGLSDAEATGQSMPDASPVKWHLAHTTWFFETFVLRDHVPGYVPFDPGFAWLFNSYYNGEGDRLDRAHRGRLIHPTLDEVWAYRAHVDAALQQAWSGLPVAAHDVLRLGVAHEQQHQELLWMDSRHLAYTSPLQRPWPLGMPTVRASPADGWVERSEGLRDLGYAGSGFAFDCETPRHRTWVGAHRLARALVTEGQWQAFLQAGGYQDPRWWLDDGWAWVQREGIQAPLYWDPLQDRIFTLDGWRALEPTWPVMHVSYYEADAFARWAGARLPTEAEWETAAEDDAIEQAFDSAWQWTQSAYLPYPGFHPAPGTVGEYNGKFMSGQMVLRGSSIATPTGHSRPSYRNFFYPHQRWAVTGVRLAQDP